MHKTIITLLAVLLMTSSVCVAATKPFGYSLNDDIHRSQRSGNEANGNTNSQDTNKIEQKFYGDNTVAAWEHAASVYPNATIGSAIRKYKASNYSGCLQEMISMSKKDKSNPVVYYYMAMSYAQLGNKEQAIKAYETVLKLNPNPTLTSYATIGRDCLVGGPACTSTGEASSFDKFVNSPYGNGYSTELNKQLKEQQLKNIQKTINSKQNLGDDDIERIERFDNQSKATPSNEEVLAALDTLKKAGITISVNPYQQAMPMDNQYAELSMLLGNNNNNNNNSMMNMMPFLLSQSQNGQNLDPQIFQSMMMNNMLPDFTFNNDKKY